MNAETLTQLRGILESVSGATLIIGAPNDLLRACSVQIAGVEASGKIWLMSNGGNGDLDTLHGATRVNVVFSKSNSWHFSVNGIATAADKHPGFGLLPEFRLGKGDHLKLESAVFIVDPQDVVSWNGDTRNNVASMFRVAKSYVIGDDGAERQLRAAS